MIHIFVWPMHYVRCLYTVQSKRTLVIFLANRYYRLDGSSMCVCRTVVCDADGSVLALERWQYVLHTASLFCCVWWSFLESGGPGVVVLGDRKNTFR